ncbi:MAG: cobalamin-binding protein [Burkholderia sp.]|nr:cobalamin-binding protein [Burkholderia sp.]
MMKKPCIALLLAWLAAASSHAAISVKDGSGATVTLAHPAQRVVTLAPHATELVFAAGAGKRLVGASDYSDYPPEANAIPRIGNSYQIDIERLLALRPDLLVVWQGGNGERQLEPLRRLGVPIYRSEPKSLDDIANEIERLGRLTGTEASARPAAIALRARLAALAERYRDKPPVSVFYQVWDQPLYTLNGRQIVSDAIRLCGGVNVFAGLAALAPTVGIEAVLQKNPEVIVRGSKDGETTTGLSMWKTYPALLAVQRGNLYTVRSDLMTRAGPRMVDGAEALCGLLDQARGKRR